MNTIKINLWKKIQRFIFRRKRVIVKRKSELRDLIRIVIKEDGYDCNLNFIDTSNITDMSKLFKPEKGNDNKLKEEDIIFTKFNGDISKWDVSNVENMSLMFAARNLNLILV